MNLDTVAAPGQRVAIAPGDLRLEERLRVACGLHGGRGSVPADPKAIGYCGREFRVYRWMSIGQAVDFYAALGPLHRPSIEANLALSHLSRELTVGRMKRAYQRALVLALQASADPDLLVVEGADEFDEAPARALLAAAIRQARRAVVTFSDEAFEEIAFTHVRGAAELSGRS